MRQTLLRLLGPALGVGLAIGGTLALTAADGPANWPQWGQNPQHQGFVDIAGQPLTNILADLTFDPNVPAEKASTGGDLLVHYQAPLLHENNVFMEFKGGPFTDADHWNTQTWSERRYHWEDGQLVEKWSTMTKLARGDGSVVSRIDPGYPATANATTFVAGPLSADSAGNVYFNAIQLDNTHPWGDDYVTDLPDSWL